MVTSTRTAQVVRRTLVSIGVATALSVCMAASAMAQESPTPHSDSVGAAVSDTAITAKVKSSFVGDDRLKGSHIKVVTTNGVVTLTGSAPTCSSPIEIARSSFSLSQRNLQQPIEQQNILFAQHGDPAAHVLEPCGEGTALSGSPPMEKRAKCVIHCQLVLTGEAGEFKCLRRRARMVSAHQIKQGRMHFSKCEHADMGQARKPSLHAFDERNRAIDLAERP